jgi:TonB family protein
VGVIRTHSDTKSLDPNNIRRSSVARRIITAHKRLYFRDQPCTDVEAHYRIVKALMVPPAMILKLGRVTRRMCIDPTRHLILRDRFEADTDAGPDRYHIVQTVTYDRINRNPTLPASLFDFQPPRNATLHQDPRPPPVAPFPSVPPRPRARVTTVPTPIERKAPEYTQEAWDEGIQGSVVLLVDVGENGAIGAIRTHQGLGYGLDEKAIEAVRSWRFKPATEVDRRRICILAIRLLSPVNQIV